MSSLLSVPRSFPGLAILVGLSLALFALVLGVGWHEHQHPCLRSEERPDVVVVCTPIYEGTAPICTSTPTTTSVCVERAP